MAYERGLLSGRDLNKVQEEILVVYLLHKQRRETELEETRFEHQLLIHRPEVYKEYMASKEAKLEENLGYDEIQWMAPEDAAEARELLDTIAQAHQQLVLDEDEEESFTADLAALQHFQGIDIALLGDEEDGV